LPAAGFYVQAADKLSSLDSTLGTLPSGGRKPPTNNVLVDNPPTAEQPKLKTKLHCKSKRCCKPLWIH